MNPKLQLIQGNITKIQVDAIVNKANTLLMGGGFVDGTIQKRSWITSKSQKLFQLGWS